MRKKNLITILLIFIIASSFFVVYGLNNNAVPGLLVGYGIQVENDYAYVSHNDGVEIINIENKDKPKVVGNIDYTDGGFGFRVIGDLVFLSADSYGLAIVNVSDPVSPIVVSETDFGVLVRKIAILDDLAFIILASNSLRILNISDPSSPSHIASFASPQSDQYTGVVVSGETLFIADRGRGVDVVNISQPSAPTLIRSISEASTFAIYTNGDLLFVSKHGAGIAWYDVSDLSNIVRVGSHFETNGEAYGVWGNNTHLYVADLQKGVYCLDISGGSISKINHYYQAAPHGITVLGNYVYLADQDKRLKIFDTELNCLYNGHSITYTIPISLVIITIGLVVYSQIKKRNSE
jgi:hypothetical protein